MLEATSADNMHALLEFMYKGEVHVSQKALESFLKAAENLQVSVNHHASPPWQFPWYIPNVFSSTRRSKVSRRSTVGSQVQMPPRRSRLRSTNPITCPRQPPADSSGIPCPPRWSRSTESAVRTSPFREVAGEVAVEEVAVEVPQRPTSRPTCNRPTCHSRTKPRTGSVRCAVHSTRKPPGVVCCGTVRPPASAMTAR